jgi:hypothetical protein
MAQHIISASALIDSPADLLYKIVADYHNGHPNIIPRPPFVSLTVEEGGVGAGTVIHSQMKMMGRVQSFRAKITEPDPGRVLVETDLENRFVTSFIVEPRDNDQRSEVTIRTEAKIRDGLFGKIEKWMLTKVLHPIYVQELQKLSEFAAAKK